LIIIDEAGFVPDELYHALNPMLAVSQGGLWLMSTPAAQSGFFFEEWSRDTILANLVPSRDGEAALDIDLRAGTSNPVEIGGNSAALAESSSPTTKSVAWHRFQVTATQCPRIRPEFLAEQRILLGDAVFRREYMCEFVAAGTQIFDYELLDSALDSDLAPFNGGAPIWRK